MVHEAHRILLAFLVAAARVGTANSLSAVNRVSGEPSLLLHRIHRRLHSGARRFRKPLKLLHSAR